MIKDYFKDFDTLKDMLLHYKEQWNDNYKDRKGTSTSSSVEEAVKLLKSNGYAPFRMRKNSDSIWEVYEEPGEEDKMKYAFALSNAQKHCVHSQCAVNDKPETCFVIPQA